MSRIRKAVVKLTDICTYMALHRRFLVSLYCKSGQGLKVTHRAEIFHHGKDRNQIILGNFVVLDGTLEVYTEGAINIGDFTFVGRSRIYCAKRITIGQYCLVADNVCIMDSDLHPLSATSRALIAERWARGKFPDVYTDTPCAPVTLDDHCWIGFGSAILKGVRIGEGAIVGANSVVTKDVPPWTIVVGNPARIIRELSLNER